MSIKSTDTRGILCGCLNPNPNPNSKPKLARSFDIERLTGRCLFFSLETMTTIGYGHSLAISSDLPSHQNQNPFVLPFFSTTDGCIGKGHPRGWINLTTRTEAPLRLPLPLNLHLLGWISLVVQRKFPKEVPTHCALPTQTPIVVLQRFVCIVSEHPFVAHLWSSLGLATLHQWCADGVRALVCVG